MLTYDEEKKEKCMKKIVGCRRAVQLGGPDHWHNWGGPAKVGARKSVLFTESSLVD